MGHPSFVTDPAVRKSDLSKWPFFQHCFFGKDDVRGGGLGGSNL
jgi:hypothetical protein